MRLLLLAIILLPLFCTAQDYQIVRSDFVHFFQDEASSYRGLKIDSIESIGNDSVFYNYKVLRSNDGFQTFEAYVPSWLGEKVVVKPSGDNLLINSNGDTIVIKTQAQLLDTWNLFQLDSSIFLEARVEGIGNETILDSLDEVKIIGLQAKDIQGQPVSHPMNGKAIVISKSLGILFGFDFHLFPEDTTQIEIVGMENPNRGVHRLTWGEIYDFQVGDEFHYFGQGGGAFITRRIQKVIGLSETGNTRSIVFDVITSELQSPPTPQGFTTEVSYDTIVQEIQELSQEVTIMPKSSSRFSPIYFSVIGEDSVYTGLAENEIGFHGSDRLACRTMYVDTWFSQDSLGVWEVFPSVSGGVSTTNRYGDAIGRTYWHYWNSDGLNWTEQYEELKYFRKGPEEWGTPFSMSLILDSPELEKSHAKIYPNPVSIGQPLNLLIGPNTTVNLISIDGKQLPIELVNGTMKTDNLISGIYILRIETETGVSTQKLVVTD